MFLNKYTFWKPTVKIMKNCKDSKIDTSLYDFQTYWRLETSQVSIVACKGHCKVGV